MPIKDQRKDGRTSGYDVEIAEKICERLVNGESLRAICADPAMPGRATVFRWLARNQEFRRSYALARQCHAEDFAFETLAIAADSSRDYVKTTGVDGKVTRVFDKENFARQRLRIKARMTASTTGRPISPPDLPQRARRASTENVGGAVFEAVFPILNPFARIPVCGLISMYNATTRPDRFSCRT
jgi:hypothetical protein